MTHFPHRFVLLMVLSLSCLCGCGGSGVHQVKVTGNVTLDGKPLDCGSIKFIASDGITPSGGGTISGDGTYTAQVPPGAKKVLITSYKVVGKEPVYAGVPDSPMCEKRMAVTSDIYNSVHRTPLEAEVTDSQDGLNFELHSDIEAKMKSL